MKMMQTFRLRAILIALCFLFLVTEQTALADAVTDLSIAANGTCASGATAFFITNNSASNGINATVAETNVVSGTPVSSTLSVSLNPGEQKLLGCSPQDSAGNYQITWKVQSAVYQ